MKQPQKKPQKQPKDKVAEINDSLLKLREALVLSLNYISVAASNLDLCIDLIDAITDNPTRGKCN